jgi:hypothetical protein
MTPASTFIYLSIIVAVLGIVAIAGFGALSLARGKVEPIKLGVLLVPAVLFGILGAAMGDWPLAAIWTLLIMMGLALGGLLVSGVTNLFS